MVALVSRAGGTRRTHRTHRTRQLAAVCLVTAVFGVVPLASASPVPAPDSSESAGGLAAPPTGPATSLDTTLAELPGARAVAPRRGAPVELSLLAGTTAPVDFAVTARARIFRHLLVDASFGGGIYGGVFAAVARAEGAESAPAEVLRSIVNGAFSVRGSVGVRPFRHRGLELVAGLGRIHGTTSMSGEAASAIAGVQLPYDAFDASLTLKTATLELACSAEFGRRFVLRPAIGVLFVRAVGVDIAAPSGARPEVVAAIHEVEAIVRHDVQALSPAPTLSFAFGVRLGPLTP